MRPIHALLGIAALTAIAIGWSPSGTLAQSAEEPAPDAETPAFVFPDAGPFAPEQIKIPNADMIAEWSRSGHSDASAEAFSHWDGEGEIPAICATCHSGAGFRSFHGLDGSEKGIADHPFPTGGVVDCDTCHNPRLGEITEIALPSGISHPVSSSEAACMTCHQGRAAGATVEKAVADLDEDTPNPELQFVNPHYKIAAVTALGGYGGVGYHYPGKTYSGRFLHAKPVATCVSCHDPHSLEVAETTCLTCHQSGDPDEIRISRVSHDGSGDTEKGIKADIQANADILKAEFLRYAAEIAGTPMIHDGARYPYFFADANGDGVIDQKDGQPVAYNSWTPRLLKAVYNWKVVQSDPGIHVHNPYYALELTYDSIEDLASATGTDFAQLGLSR